MKIIHCVESYTPAVNGMQTVVSQLSERLVEKGHEVLVLTSKHPARSSSNINGVKILDFDIQGSLVNGITGEIEAFEHFILNEPCDIFVNFAAQQWSTDLCLPKLSSIKGKKVFVPTGFSAFYDSRFKEYYKQMQSWIKVYDANVFLSDDYRDINFARQHAAKNIILIPNGADERAFGNTATPDIIKKKFGIAAGKFNVLTVGSHTGLKGHNETIEVFRRCKIKHSNLFIVGNSPRFAAKFLFRALAKTFLSFFTSRIKPDCTLNCHLKRVFFNLSLNRLFDGKRIYTKDLTRSEAVEMFKIADIFLFASNIECSPIVLFECAAAGLPFLVADVGNSPEIISWTGAGRLLQTQKDDKGFSHIDIERSALDLGALAADEDLRRTYATNGLNAFRSEFNWAAITTKYEELYNFLLKQDNR